MKYTYCYTYMYSYINYRLKNIMSSALELLITLELFSTWEYKRGYNS